MRHLFSTWTKSVLIMLSVFIVWQMKAQDTTYVQTITWDNESRSGTFQFPDADENFQRVLMYYNMRCKGGGINTTGGNDVACGEWDYSCNTFVTVPEMTDSTRRNHPTHIVTNFTNEVGDVFEYTSEPTYTYLQFEQHHTTLTNPFNEISAQVGEGTQLLPLAADQPIGKAQFLFSAAELNDAGLTMGEIDALRLDLSQIGDDVDFMRIRLKATSKTVLDNQSPDLDGFTEVYFQNTSFSTTGWQNFNFYQPFMWDGTSNLIVETSFTGATANNIAQGHDTGANMALFNAQADNSLLFNGAGGVDVPAANFSSIENEITISLWCYGTPDIMPASSTIFEGRDDDNNRQVNVHLPWSNSQVYWDCGNDGSGYDRINATATEADFEGKWNHWAFTKNAVSGEMKIYLNGAEWLTGTDKFKPINITDFDIASSVTWTNKYFGKVDEVRVWNVELDEATIQNYMRRPVDATHPNYSNLIANYSMDEGIGLTTSDSSPNAEEGAIYGSPAWSTLRGKDLYKNFITSTLRLNMIFLQGDYTTNDEVITVLDSVPNAPDLITYYEVDGTDLVEVNTEVVYASGDMNILDEAGNVVGTIPVAMENSVEIGQLTYYLKAEARVELLSMVTPYGINLDLGPTGKTWVFDVTDFSPLLRGERFISMQFGIFQEEMDIEFAFIHGTPPAEVLGIQNIWPFARGGYQAILDDAIFEPRDITLNPEGHTFKLRSSITGHDQNGEFIPRIHYLNIDGGVPELAYEIWKECAFNPVYPQGGTWTFDRAGWCPGAPTDVHETDISILVEPGQTINLDYTVEEPGMSSANYLVSNMLVTYGEPNYETDAMIYDIMRPSTRVEYQRINPVCSNPMIVLQNTGSSTITSATINYRVRNGFQPRSFTWTGNLGFLETAEIELPVDDEAFYSTPDDEKVFIATITSINGSPDENAQNNTMESVFEWPDMLDMSSDFTIYLFTNNHSTENSYTVKDINGNIVLSRSNFAANTAYEDQIDFPAGCYTIEFKDNDNPSNQYGHNGLSYWFHPEAGNGNFRIRQSIGAGSISFRNFDPDFGGGVQYDFVVGEITDASAIEHVRLLSIYPNPTQDIANLELIGFEGEQLDITVTDLTGRVLKTQRLEQVMGNERIETIDLQGLAQGIYFIKVANNDRVWTQEVVKI